MNPDPLIKVTVAIPTYNRSALLRQTLEGIAAQEFPRRHHEILIIDNNSSDDTRAVVASFAGADPAPRYILETRQGLDHARNRAIAEARGEIILFADDDILVKPDWITQMARPILADPEQRRGAVGGEVIPIFPNGLPPWVAAWHGPLAFRRDAGPLPRNQTPMGANLAIPRWIFAALGPFQTALDRSGKNLFGGGDAEMIRRIRAAKYEVWFAPAAAVRHQMPASRTTFRYAARHAFDSARSRVVDRAGQPSARLYMATRLVSNIFKAVGFVLLAAVWLLVLRTGKAKQSLVRAWRCCGYIYQVPRSWFGRI